MIEYNDATLPVEPEDAQRHAMAILWRCVRLRGLDWKPTPDDGWEAVNEWYIQRGEGSEEGNSPYALHAICDKIARRSGQPLSTDPRLIRFSEPLGDKDFAEDTADHHAELADRIVEELPAKLAKVVRGLLALIDRRKSGGHLDLHERLWSGKRFQSLERETGLSGVQLAPLLADLKALAAEGFANLDDECSAQYRDHGEDQTECWSLPFVWTDRKPVEPGVASPCETEHNGYVEVRTKCNVKVRRATTPDRSAAVDLNGQSDPATETDWTPKPVKPHLMHWGSKEGWLVVADWSI